MNHYRQVFDRDLALFDASGSLTFFREFSSIKEKPKFLKISTNDFCEAEYYFPRLMSSLSELLKPNSWLELIFFPDSIDGTYCISTGDAKEECEKIIFFISTQIWSEFQPGDCVFLNPGEELFLNYNSVAYGFLGISSASGRGS